MGGRARATRKRKAAGDAPAAQCWALALPTELWQRTLHWLYVDDLFKLAQVCKSFNSTFGDPGLVVEPVRSGPEGTDAADGCASRALTADDSDPTTRQPKGYPLVSGATAALGGGGGAPGPSDAGGSGSYQASTPARDGHAAAHPHYSTPRIPRGAPPSSPTSAPAIAEAGPGDGSAPPTLFVIATCQPTGGALGAAHNRKRPVPTGEGHARGAGHFRSLAAAVAAAPPHAVLKLLPGIHWLGTQASARPTPTSPCISTCVSTPTSAPALPHLRLHRPRFPRFPRTDHTAPPPDRHRGQQRPGGSGAAAQCREHRLRDDLPPRQIATRLAPHHAAHRARARARSPRRRC